MSLESLYWCTALGPEIASFVPHLWPFFSGIDWEKLEQKNVTPPFVPESKPLPEAPEYSSIEDMLRSLGHAAWITAIPTEEEQRYYATW